MQSPKKTSFVGANKTIINVKESKLGVCHLKWTGIRSYQERYKENSSKFASNLSKITK